MGERRSAVWALVFLVPAPSLGAWIGLHVAPGPVGSAVWGASKIWLALLPLVWWRFVERRPLRFPTPSSPGWRVGLLSGVLIAAAILAAPYLVPASILDPAPLRDLADQAGFATPFKFLLIALYICTVNALLEEYVWRWFTFVKCETVFGRRVGVVASALFFTLHHIIVLARYLEPSLVALGSLGVFLGGVTWSSLYLRYRSIWPGFISHVAADIAIFVVGWNLLF